MSNLIILIQGNVKIWALFQLKKKPDDKYEIDEKAIGKYSFTKNNDALNLKSSSIQQILLIIIFFYIFVCKNVCDYYD